MAGRFRKIASVAVCAALALSSLQFVAAAEETSVSIEFIGVNATITEGTYGENAASVGEDYTTTVTIPDGYEITYMDCYGLGDNNMDYYIPFDYDDETGSLSIPGESITGDNIELWIFASRDYNEETDLSSIDSLPYEETFKIGEENAITEIGFCATLYSIGLKAGETILVSLYGTESTDTDTQLLFCEFAEDGELSVYDYCDVDSYGDGERWLYTAVEDETLYIAASVYDTSIDEEVVLKVEYADPDEYGKSLDFTLEAIPEPEEGDLWEWDSSTNTLTLYDGFEITSLISNGITLPEDSTIIVEGKASVSSLGEAVECYGALTIELSEGAELTINSSDSDAIEINTGDLTITGTPDADGNLPKLIVPFADDDGINVVDGGDIIIDSCDIDITLESQAVKTTNGSVYITDSTVNIDSESAGIVSLNGEITIENSDIEIKSEEAGIYTAVPAEDTDSDESVSHFVTITDSSVEVRAETLGIGAIDDGIVITDSEVTVVAESGLYIEEEGYLEVTGGCLEVVTDTGIITVPDGDVTLDNVSISLYSRGDATERYYIGNGVLSATGIIEATDGENTYIGEWPEGIIKEDGSIIFTAEDGTEFSPLIIMSYFEGKTEDNEVSGIESEYTKGDEISFTTSSTTPEPEYPISGNTRYSALRWEIEGTELSGWVENNEGIIDTSGLEAGEYTLNVIFAKQAYSPYGGWGAVFSDPETAVTDTVSITFTVVADESEEGGDAKPDGGDAKPDGGEIDSSTDKGEDNDNPETGVGFGSVLAVMAISGAVILTSRRKNK